MAVNQMMQGKFKGAWLDLFFKIDHNHGVLIVVVRLEVWHKVNPLSDA